MGQQKLKPQSTERQLLDYVERLSHHRSGRRALFVALSRLTPPGRLEEHWRLAEPVLVPVVRHHGGDIFRTSSGDVVTIIGSADKDLGERLTNKLRYLFHDDPHASADRGKKGEGFIQEFDLATDYDAFFELICWLTGEPGQHSAEARSTTPRLLGSPSLQDSDKAPLGGLHDFLYGPARDDRRGLQLCVRRPAMRLSDGVPTLAFEWLSPRNDLLVTLGLPRNDVERNPEIETSLSALVCERILRETAEAKLPAAPLALSLHIESVLGAGLIAFHRHWSSEPWQPVTFIVPFAEVTSDEARFDYARNFIRGLGHHIGVLGLSLADILAMDLPDVDLAVVNYDAQQARSARSKDLSSALLRRLEGGLGERLLLDGADKPEAVSFGQKSGISLFAGRQTEARLQTLATS